MPAAKERTLDGSESMLYQGRWGWIITVQHHRHPSSSPTTLTQRKIQYNSFVPAQGEEIAAPEV